MFDARSTALALLLAATACGDDDPSGAGGRAGSGGATSGSAGPGETSSTTSSSQTAGGSGQGGTPGEGGAPGEGGGDTGIGGAGGAAGGGGAAAAPHTVEIALKGSPADGDRSVVQVLVSDGEGALLERLYGDELPVLRDLEDGWTVSLLDADSWGSLVTSARVTPEVDRIEHFATLPGAETVAPCDYGAPMALTFTVPAVPGAAEYRIETSVVPHAIPVEPGSPTVEVVACEGQESLIAIAVARDASGEVVALELVSPIPYVPGGSSSHALTMPPPTRTTIDVDLGDLDGASSVRADATWWVPSSPYYFGLVIHEPHHFLDVQAPSPTVTYAPSILAPGIGVHDLWATVSTSHGDGWCSTRRLDHGGGFGGPTALDLGWLRRPVPIDEAAASWTWDGGGTVGEVLTRRWTVPSDLESYPGPVREILWTLVDDPRSPPRTAVLPQLPDDLPPDFERPTGAPELHSIWHEDDEAIDAYADVVRSVYWPHVHTTRSRSTRPCP